MPSHFNLPFLLWLNIHSFTKRKVCQHRHLKGTRVGIFEDLTPINVNFIATHHQDPRIYRIWSWNGRLFATATKDGLKRILTPSLPLAGELTRHLLSFLSVVAVLLNTDELLGKPILDNLWMFPNYNILFHCYPYGTLSLLKMILPNQLCIFTHSYGTKQLLCLA